MDGTRFDALTKRLATATSRRRVLTGLGGALAGALVLHRGAAAAGVDCDADLRACLEQADAAFADALRACAAGPPVMIPTCLSLAVDQRGAAEAQCRRRYARCTGACKPDEAPCSRNEECCSGRCGVVAADPRPVFGCT
jgi:hypothetical protein